MTVTIAIVTAAVLLPLIALAAYHHGIRHGRVTLPPALVGELREHKVRCIGEPPERVALEIGLLCESDDRRKTAPHRNA